MAPKQGYMGLASISGVKVAVTNFDVYSGATPAFYDHVVGVIDTSFSGSATKSGGGTTVNTQRAFWRTAPYHITGGFSFPGTEFLGFAKNAATIECEMSYVCSGTIARKFTGCKINSWSFSVTAGDVATTTVEIMGTGEEDGSEITDLGCTTLTTWRSINVSITADSGGTDYGGDIQGIEINVNNNCIPIYTSSGPLAYKIRAGMQEVSGALTLYSMPDFTIMDDVYTLTISGGSLNATINCMFLPFQRHGGPSPFTVTVPFIGVGKALGD